MKLATTDLVPGCYVFTEYYPDRAAYVTQVRADGYVECRYSDVTGDFAQSIDQLFPIELSPDWLKRLGLIYSPGLHGREYYDLKSNQRWSVEWHYSATLFNGPIAFMPVFYVHSLQTLIWNVERVWLSINK